MTDFIYIDEEPREGRKLLRLAVGSKYFSEEQVKYVEPLADLEATVEEILSSGAVALITDYKLGDKVDYIDYDGANVVSRVLERSRNFLCFITTSFPEDAINTNVDSFNVYFKEDIEEPAGDAGPRITFFQRVRQSVDNRRAHLSVLSKRHAELVAHSLARELSPAETEEFIYIDSQLEEELSFDTATPNHLKVHALSKFGSLLSETEALIQTIKTALPQSLEDGSERS